MEEAQLLENIRKGDREAFREVVETYQDKVYNTVFTLVRHEEDALDLSQEVFIEVYSSIQRFRGDASLSTWIYRIAVNKALNHLKRRKRKFSIFRGSITESENDHFSGMRDTASNPEQKLEGKELALEIQRALDNLPERQRVAFVLHKIEGLSYQQVAGILKTSLSSVESLMHRAKTQLQQSLYDQWEHKR